MEVARPILFGVLIIIAVYLPIFTLEGLEGKMFRPMAITVCSAIFGALLLSLTAVPAASSLLLKMGGTHHEERWFVRLRERYLRHLAGAMRHRVRTIAVAVTVVSVAIGSLLVHRHRVHAAPRRRRDPDRDAQAAVDLARGIGGHLDARGADRPALSRGLAGGDQARTPGTGHRSDGHLPGRRLREPPPGGDVDDRPGQGRLDRGVGRGAGRDARRGGQLHAADGDAARRGRVGRQGRRGGEDLRRGQRDARATGRGGEGGARPRAGRGRPAGRGLLGRVAAAAGDRPAGDRAVRAATSTDVQRVVEAAVGGTEATDVLDGPKRIPVVVKFPEARARPRGRARPA